MKLEAITAIVRPRLGWEALDLGFRMVHVHWRALFGIWFGLTFIPFVAALLLFPDSRLWVLFIFWWLKPIFETAILNYISRALFGEFPTLKDTLKSFHRYAFKQWFAQLTWRRFSPTRSMDLAVSQLEGLSGTQRSRRIGTLHSFNSGAASWLTILFLFFQFLFYINLIALVFWLIPEIYLVNIENYFREFFWSKNAAVVQFIQALMLYLIMSFFSPFYAVGGFAIYINQRTILEAWDIELAFKRLAQRVGEKQQKRKLRNIASKIAPCIIAIFFTFAFDAQGQTNDSNDSQETAYLTHETAKQKIDHILDNEPFKRKEERVRYYYDFGWDFETDEDEDEDEDERDTDYSSSGSFLGGIFGGFAALVEVLLWTLVIGLVAWLIYRIAFMAEFKKGRKGTKKQTDQPEVLFGIEISPEALPQEPAKESWQLWQQGKHRLALSLLLRATLTHLIDKHQCEFEDGYTELECARVVRASTQSSVSQYFESLIKPWRLFAYGHQLPSDEIVKHLCEQWETTFPIQPSSSNGVKEGGAL